MKNRNVAKVIDPPLMKIHPLFCGDLLEFANRSLWALIPAGFASIVLIVRTRWEDQTLQEELNGYRSTFKESGTS